jgi:uncharacterized membrane protein YphA (DoxX/SURF4 family)
MTAQRWSIAHARSALEARWFAPALPGPLGLCRALFFATLLLRVAPQVQSAPWAEVAPVFWMPTDLFALLHLGVAPAAVLTLLDAIWRASLVLACIGLWTRAACTVAFVLGVYLLGLPQCFGKIDHWSGLLVLTMGVLALARSGDAWSWDALRRERRGAPAPSPSGEYRWPLELGRILLVLVFFAAGIAKLRQGGLAWASADNMRAILLAPHYANDRALPALGLDVADSALLCGLLAVATIVAEVGAPLALLGGAVAGLVIGTLFAMQLGIATLIGVHGTFPFLACYVFWLPWRGMLAVEPARGAHAARDAARVARSALPQTRVVLTGSRRAP